MNWDALGAIGEIVGAIAVVLTLIYLSRQIKHSSDVSKVSSYHEAITQIVEAAKDPDFHRFQHKFAIQEPLNPEEQVKSDLLATLFIYSHEILLHLYEQGQVDEVLWENIMDNNMGYLTGDMMLPVLKARTGRLSRNLTEIIEGRMDDA
jgi:hypothetical protein